MNTVVNFLSILLYYSQILWLTLIKAFIYFITFLPNYTLKCSHSLKTTLKFVCIHKEFQIIDA